MSENEQLSNAAEAPRPASLGCVGTLAGINLVITGLVACTFAVGPYSSAVQEAWYRGGSIAFLSVGAILPIATLLLFAHRGGITAITIWMVVTLLAFLSYLFMSFGGV